MTKRNRFMRRGEVLRVTMYGFHDCDCWVLIDEDVHLFEVAGGKFIAGEFPQNRSHTDRECSIDGDDVFEVIRADRVPQYVITEIARLTLLGEL